MGADPNNAGSGHLWPVLAGERGQYEVDRGMAGAAISRLEAMRNMSSGVGLIAEQAWEVADLAALAVRDATPTRRRSASRTASRPARRPR